MILMIVYDQICANRAVQTICQPFIGIISHVSHSNNPELSIGMKADKEDMLLNFLV